MDTRKISALIVFLAIGVFLSGGLALAQRAPEVPLPGLDATTKLPLLPAYVGYIFNFAVGVAGLIAFLSLVYGGVRYLTSGGNPSAMSDANDQIFSALIGLLIILGSFLLLTTINPQLVLVKSSPEAAGLVVSETPGVYLCKDGSGTICDGPYLSSINAVKRNFEDNANYIKFVNPSGTQYGVVLHEKRYREGQCQVVRPSESVAATSQALSNKVSSLTVFRATTTSSGEGVSLYEKKNYSSRGLSWPTTGGYKDESFPNLDEKGNSIKIENEGEYMAVLFEGKNYGQKCEVFTQNDPDLAANPIGVCGNLSNMGCFRSVIVMPVW